jgi:2-dehydro-3-deoxyphosphogluconate aldolase/(4S)-4-hydroxy-2-oxoglutarate aldolase
MFDESIGQRVHATGVVAVLVLERENDAVPVARALLAGGVDCIELTLRTPCAMEAARRIHDACPQMLLGMGTVITPAQVREVAALGASFAVAPGLNPRVIAAAREAGLPFAPGVCTPTDIELAVEAGCRLVKFFPAEPSGGLAYLRAIYAPFAHLGLRFIPLGGVDSANAAAYLREPSVAALGGSWLAPKDVIARGDWAAITAAARAARAVVEHTRGGSLS